jgi:DnaJ-domain-containing protein 1
MNKTRSHYHRSNLSGVFLMKPLFYRIILTIRSWWEKLTKWIKTKLRSWWEKLTRWLKRKTKTQSNEKDDYGESKETVGTREPEDYPKVGPKDEPSDNKYKPWLSKVPPISRQTPWDKWPQLSQQLLHELFAELGTAYVPEIVLHQTKTQDPVSAFVDFCNRFNEPDGKPATRKYLQDVVLFLFQMDDELRQRRALSPDPIYRELEQHQWRKAEKLFNGMENAINLLNELESCEARLGQHRRILNRIKEILPLEWADYLDNIEELYNVHLAWLESESQYRLLQEQIATRIRTIDEHCRIVQARVASAYQNLKRIWSQCTAFLESEDETEGNPDDPEWGFDKLEQLRDALDVILASCGESVSEPVDESEMSLEKAWEILGLESRTLDFELIKKAFRRKAMENHPDRHPESEKKYYHNKFIQIQQAYDILKKESHRHG